jgi:TonB family protein
VILVFFGEDNWGKLTNMSESGMAFEFSKPPSSCERVKFTFQAMGRMPTPRNGKVLGDSFEAPGRIVWTREFERGAGVQFVDLAEASREQVRQWLSFEASTNTSTLAERAKPKAQPIVAELVAPLEPGSNSQSAGDKKGSLLELDMPVPVAETVPESDPAFLELPVAESYEGPVWSGREKAAEGQHVTELPVTSHPSVARLTFLVVSGCLAAFAITAGVRIFMTRAAHRADAAVRASDSALGIGESTVEANIPSPVPSAAASVTSSPSMSSATSSSVAGAPPFQVDVLDASGRSWILWFVRRGAKPKGSQTSYDPSESTSSSAATMKIPRRQEEASPQKPQTTHTFTMVAPNLSHPVGSSSSGNPPAEVPPIQTEILPSSGEPLSGTLGRQMAPAAPPVHVATGEMVQQPRLIQSGPPIYPQLAKSIRVSGDVDVDALIDAAGNVTAVKVISGPALLQHAAVETVRQWKYEPARLDGQAVAMHLTVTVRFRLN